MENRRNVSQENCSNEGKHKDLQVRVLWFFVAEKRLQRSITGSLQFFYCDRSCGSFSLGLLIAGRSQSANQLNIADTIGEGDPVGNRNNRPLLCLAFAISQRA